jgi:hypothetical protein
MNNVQNCNSYSTITSSETYRSCLEAQQIVRNILSIILSELYTIQVTDVSMQLR